MNRSFFSLLIQSIKPATNLSREQANLKIKKYDPQFLNGMYQQNLRIIFMLIASDFNVIIKYAHVNILHDLGFVLNQQNLAGYITPKACFHQELNHRYLKHCFASLNCLHHSYTKSSFFLKVLRAFIAFLYLSNSRK